MFEKTRASNWSTAHVQFSRWSRIFMYCTIKFLQLWVNLRRVFLFLPICSLWFKPSKGKMNWYEQWEPQNSFRETVEVMRNGSYYPEVTIYYHNRGRGGKWKLFLSSFFRFFDSTTSQCPKVNIRNCFHSFVSVQYHRWRNDSMGRKRRKRSKTSCSNQIREYDSNNPSSQRRFVCLRAKFLSLEVKYDRICTAKTIRFYLVGYSLNTRGFWKNELGRTYY